MKELLPRFGAEALVDEFKQSGGGLKGILEATEMYSGKHYSRVDGNLKRTFYVQYVLSQMTLLEDNNKAGSKARQQVQKSAEAQSDRKREKKAKGKKDTKVDKEARKGKKKSKTEGNLFV